MTLVRFICKKLFKAWSDADYRLYRHVKKSTFFQFLGFKKEDIKT